MKKAIKNCKLDPTAMVKIFASNMPDAYKNVFEVLMELSKKTNSEKTLHSLTWHDKNVAKDDFVPFMIFGVQSAEAFERENSKRVAKSKKNPKKFFQVTIPVRKKGKV